MLIPERVKKHSITVKPKNESVNDRVDVRSAFFCAFSAFPASSPSAPNSNDRMQEYLAQLVDRTPRSIMYFENRGQHPSLNTFYQIVTLLDISVDQFFYPDRQNSESDCRQHIDIMLNSMDEKELTVMEATAEGLQKARETEVK